MADMTLPQGESGRDGAVAAEEVMVERLPSPDRVPTSGSPLIDE
jgi:hypothetical protein